MRELSKTIKAKIVEWCELTDEQQKLLSEAARVRNNAQAPYSHFFVGVAVAAKKGGVYTTAVGCNVERASWTQTTHAEQNAIDTAVANLGPAKIFSLAMALGPEGKRMEIPPKLAGKPIKSLEDIIVPCGHCLQIIWENCMGDGGVELITLLPNGEISLATMDVALPIKFGPADLGVDYSK